MQSCGLSKVHSYSNFSPFVCITGKYMVFRWLLELRFMFYAYSAMHCIDYQGEVDEDKVTAAWLFYCNMPSFLLFSFLMA